MRARITLLAFAAAFLLFGGYASAAIYWANSSTIGRVNLDGTNRLDGNGPGLLYIGYNGSSDIAGACGIAVNGTHIFWGDSAYGRIGRANLDGSSPSYAFIVGASEPCGVAVNDSHVFWANRGGTSIGRADLVGTNVDQEFVKGLDRPCGTAVDDAHVFWGSFREDTIGRASLDGESVEKDFITEVDGACGVASNSSHVYWGVFW